MRRTLTWTILLALIAGVAHAESYEKILKRYKVLVKRTTLRKRTLGRRMLANTGDDRALPILMADYAKPKKPKDQVRYVIAYMVTDSFAEEKHASAFAQWRAKHKKPMDAWLWYRTLILHHETHGGDDLVALAKSDKLLWFRAAAVEVLRFRLDPVLLTLIPALCAKLPDKPVERAVMLESMAAGLAAMVEYRDKPELTAPATALFKQMDRPTTTKRTKIVMGRYFAKLFKSRYVWTNGARWMGELRYAQSGGKVASLDGYAKKKPTFAGIEANGDRICYVIDMSDSMLTPLKPAELKKLPKGPVTGKPGQKARARAAKSDAWKKAFENVKWKNVKNRFDAARELLKTSLLGLEEHQYFTVIWFGDKAATLMSTKGLVKATAGNVKKTFAELDRIRPGAKKDGRPHGTLRGATNLHGALHRAFKLKGQGAVGAGEYVNLSTWKGCDAIFVLSDGDPTWDDWAGTDVRDPWDQVGDPESGARGQSDATTLNFPGPYAQSGYLISDVRRLNLYRKVEIHCVGMGEANMSTLQRLAGIGIGQAISLRGR
ncbi:MAG: hypothetical protein OER88_06410 [Planctomycetota bacterium]|nr:hypothetical protein [Planctomycetota bacterium]